MKKRIKLCSKLKISRQERALLIVLLLVIVLMHQYTQQHNDVPANYTRVGVPEMNAIGNNVQNFVTKNSTKSQSLRDPSLPQSRQVKKVILAFGSYLDRIFLVNGTFSPCEFSKCSIKSSEDINEMKDADVLLFQYNRIKSYPAFDWTIRSRQYWVLYSNESPAYKNHNWRQHNVKDGQFNVTLTYRRGSPAVFSFGITQRKTEESLTGITQYRDNLKKKIRGKTKGAFVYISQCGGVHYNRMKTVEVLKRYIDVDTFGACYRKQPCKWADFECEEKLHTQYRFYLSFENALCADYITEKFWDRLKSSALVVPVAVGGLSVEEYTKVAPPDSFIHAYSYNSIHELGKFLQWLMRNPTELMKYHYWRRDFDVRTDKRACDICKLAYSNAHLDGINHLATWWHSAKCKTLNQIRNPRSYNIVYS